MSVKYVCSLCGYVYDEAEGSPETGVAPARLSSSCRRTGACPLCGAGREEFEPE